MILGVGALVANTICPFLIQQTFTKAGVTDFHGLFMVPCLSAVAAALILALFFHPPRKEDFASAHS
jgi:succinate dehydrogenase/fumarate reductase cytochrome b subunit